MYLDYILFSNLVSVFYVNNCCLIYKFVLNVLECVKVADLFLQTAGLSTNYITGL